jgi:hypothetical protein
VRVAVLESAQDGKCRRLLFGFATFFGVCFGVQNTFLCTCGTWLYVETDGMCMCKHVSTAILLHMEGQKKKRSVFAYWRIKEGLFFFGLV